MATASARATRRSLMRTSSFSPVSLVSAMIDPGPRRAATSRRLRVMRPSSTDSSRGTSESSVSNDCPWLVPPSTASSFFMLLAPWFLDADDLDRDGAARDHRATPRLETTTDAHGQRVVDELVHGEDGAGRERRELGERHAQATELDTQRHRDGAQRLL